MNQGGTPDAHSDPIMAPAEVPTTQSALAGSQPVSSASACNAPVSHAPPITPPAPSTSPTRGRLAAPLVDGFRAAVMRAHYRTTDGRAAGR